MSITNLKVILITMGVSKVINTLLDSEINIIGVIESKKRNVNMQHEELKNFCLEIGLPYYFMNEGCNDRLEKWVKELEPDLIVISGMSELLKGNILNIPKKGCINLHLALLPKYRGSHPIFWTYYNHDLNPGATVHYIDEGEDTGNIICQESYDLPIGSTEEEMIRLSSNLGCKLLIKSILEIENNCAPSIKQPIESPTVRARQIHPDEYKEIVNWKEWEIERIWHLLRGTQNWFNVFDFSEIQGNVSKWRILNYSKKDVRSRLDLGKVYKRDDLYFVLCGLGYIYMEISFEGEVLLLFLGLFKNVFTF
ncbi:methionyl-tRNA formyltransferase [Lysinibacillus contaminans]|uniref:methionyl-tRNA formyltransferase n=1 Tax=Lysinibacillus contaminans TaxID=1293441 RepID=UPI0006ADB549|nr:formyltransferase family protein [Lysinibacillus contaminans]